MPVPPNVDFEAARTQSHFTISQVYRGPSFNGRIVVNQGNIVYDPLQGLLEVSFVDPDTYIPTFKPANVTNPATTQGDLIIGGTIASSITKPRILIDDSRLPFTMAFDRRFITNHVAASHVKVFKGSSIENGSLVISAMYDQTGIKVSENIPLALVYFPDGENYTLKAPVKGWCVESVENYDTLTVVVYSEDGDILDTQLMVAYKTTAIASSDRAKRYISALSIESSFLSPTNNNLLEYPVGITVQSGAIKVRVLYSDGSTARLPIDGDKVNLFGLDDLIASESGRTSNLTLSYRLGDDEIAEDSVTSGIDRYKNKNIQARAITNSESLIYNLKLFVVPTWVGGVSPHWELKYFLYNLERLDIFEVTGLIEVGAGSAAFDGTLIGVAQNLTVAINVENVSGRYQFHRHVQSFIIKLDALGSSVTAPSYWSIQYSPGVIFGQGKKAIVSDDPNNVGRKRVRMDTGFAVVGEWLSALYYDAFPLFNTLAESAPIVPTHVRVRIGTTWQRQISVTSFAAPIDDVDAVIAAGQDLRLEWIYEDAQTIKELAITSLTLVEP